MRQFTVTLILVWTAASIAAFFYSQQQNIQRPLLIALLPAFLIEIGLYLAPGFEAIRRAFDELGSKPLRASLLALSATAPYLIESLRTHTFGITPFVILLALVLAASFWYALLKPSLVVDLLFLIFIAAVSLSRVFNQIYGRPAPHVQLEILGILMWRRLGIMAVLSLRHIEKIRFGFIPSSAEWRIGIEHFLYFVPVGAAAAYLLKFAHFQPLRMIWWKYLLFVPVLFVGILWVVALGEEFFFRGFLQQLMARRLDSALAGLIVSAVLFGCAHLPYRAFPNWRFAIVAAIAGLFYGLAFLRARSVRAGMVTHALVVTMWRTLFTA